jgi:hypothetical protein
MIIAHNKREFRFVIFDIEQGQEKLVQRIADLPVPLHIETGDKWVEVDYNQSMRPHYSNDGNKYSPDPINPKALLILTKILVESECKQKPMIKDVAFLRLSPAKGSRVPVVIDAAPVGGEG